MNKISLQKVINFCHKYIPRDWWSVDDNIIHFHAVEDYARFISLEIKKDSEGFLIRKTIEYPHDIYEDTYKHYTNLDNVFKEIESFLSWEHGFEIEFPKEHYTIEDLFQKFNS